MTDRLTDLLEEVADDGGRRLPFTSADVVRRGRAAKRRRDTLVAVPVAVAAAATVVAVSWGGGGEPAPVSPGPATASGAPSPTSDPTREPDRELTGQDALAVARCEHLGNLDGYHLDAQVTDEEGLTATFVSDDGTRWRVCTAGGASVDGVTPAWPLDRGPISDDIAFDGSIEYATRCAKDVEACSGTLYTGAFPLREDVDSVRIRTPQGRDIAAARGAATYIVRFSEPDVDDPLPPVVASLRDVDGRLLYRYDYNDLMR